ncbi:hypothetical protein [Staphylococcus intermedius]|uniref:hypothetical protein n=1 Tax=Staphylococcus intermedius TaxID=1285 RepID=UPI000BBC516E|nr:hypothetical protein [Staphylococcus intermedius]PCF86448.1 hypothetical protein B4W75_10875 [Staphylococcus intermedius]
MSRGADLCGAFLGAGPATNQRFDFTITFVDEALVDFPDQLTPQESYTVHAIDAVFLERLKMLTTKARFNFIIFFVGKKRAELI